MNIDINLCPTLTYRIRWLKKYSRESQTTLDCGRSHCNFFYFSNLIRYLNLYATENYLKYTSQFVDILRHQ